MKPARYASAEAGALQLSRLLTSEKKIANVSKSGESSLSPSSESSDSGSGDPRETRAVRRHLRDERHSLTHDFPVGGQEGTSDPQTGTGAHRSLLTALSHPIPAVGCPSRRLSQRVLFEFTPIPRLHSERLAMREFLASDKMSAKEPMLFTTAEGDLVRF